MVIIITILRTFIKEIRSMLKSSAGYDLGWSHDQILCLQISFKQKIFSFEYWEKIIALIKGTMHSFIFSPG